MVIREDFHSDLKLQSSDFSNCNFRGVLVLLNKKYNFNNCVFSNVIIETHDINGELFFQDCYFYNTFLSSLQTKVIMKNTEGFLALPPLTSIHRDSVLNQATINYYNDLPEDDMIVWKQTHVEYLRRYLVKLLIPCGAKRVRHWSGKCRASEAIVLETFIIKPDRSLEKQPDDLITYSAWKNSFSYKVGQTVKEPEFDPNPNIDCTRGIHFYLDKKRAQEY